MKVLSLTTNKHANFYKKQKRSLEQRGVTIETLAPPPQPSSRKKRKQTTRSVWNYLHLYLKVLKNQISDFDLVHANNGLTAPFALAQRFRPVVLTFWGSDLMKNQTKLCQWTARHAGAVIVPSQTMASYLDTEYRVIPFGIDPDLFSPMPQSEAREEIGWETDKKIVLFPYSKSRAVKNYPLAKRIVDQCQNTELRQISGISHDQMPVYMNASDCVLVTSEREAGPMVVKEAALCNVPVISTDVGFASDVLSNISNSYVCDSERKLLDAIQKTLNNGERSNGRDLLLEEASIEKMGDRIFDVYQDVLEAHS